jgi:capsular polysaccharide biosynthesis protein
MQTSVKNQNCGFNTEEIYLSHHQNVLFDGRTGILLNQNNQILLESAKNLSRLKKSATYHQKIPRKWDALHGTYSSIYTPYIHNHFHWLIESLPRIYSLKSYEGSIRLLLPENISEWNKKILAWCLPANVTIQSYRYPWMAIQFFIFPSFITTVWDFAFLPSEYLYYISQKIVTGIGISDPQNSKNLIYISREKASKRKIINEEEVIQCVSKYGFKSYLLEELTFEKQIELFRSAKAVVGLHGAGFANIIFSKKIKILEIPSHTVTPVYFFLAMAMQHEYYFILPFKSSIEKQITTDRGKLYTQERDKDVFVNIADLDTTLKKMLKS